MRITGGEWRGRKLAVPNDPRIRPTGEKVREAWMSVLGPDLLAGAKVLDLFAGTGALGIEALSRGAAFTTFVDISPQALRTVAENLDSVGAGDRARIRRIDALRLVAGLDSGDFDLVLADPPWSTDHISRLVDIFLARRFAPILAVEHPAVQEIGGGVTRQYGDTALTILRNP